MRESWEWAMQLEINGQLRGDLCPRSVSELLDQLGLPAATALVELNGRALLRSEWSDANICEGDRIEILRVSAGG